MDDNTQNDVQIPQDENEVVQAAPLEDEAQMPAEAAPTEEAAPAEEEAPQA
jgi:hypothetical protein